MPGRSRVLIVGAVTGIILTAGCASFALNYRSSSNALWNIVSQKCLPNQNQNNDPTPCRVADIRNGYVVLKDRNGPLQFLLLPVEKISGIESPVLLNPSSPNYLAEAWHARHFMEERRGAHIEDSAVALTINSQRGRTQNQLHIHISCLRPEIRQRLNELSPRLDSLWQSEQLGKHVYQIRAITRDEFKKLSPLVRIANELPGARDEMGKYGVAVAALADGRRAIMVLRRNLLLFNTGSAEELQDHSCAILQGSRARDLAL